MSAENKNDALERLNVIVRSLPMHDQILPHLRKAIVENRWKSGERLPEPELCREFGTSRTPLRQVLKTLEAEGLVRLIPHVGAVVSDPDATEVAETMEILIGLEQLAAIRVAESRPPAVLAEIERIHREMQDAAQRHDATRYFDLNDDFHRAIVQGTGNRSLAQLHEKVMWHVHRERHRANAVEPLSVQSADNHEQIVRAILERRPDEAGQAMREHLETVSRHMQERRLAEQLARQAAAKTRKTARAGA